MSRLIRIVCSSLALAVGAAALDAQQPTQPAQPAAPNAAQPPAQRQQQQLPVLPANGWRIDMSHSAVTFRVRHLGISWVNGRFTASQGQLIFDPANPPAPVLLRPLPPTRP